jgi:hypothetical protein
MVATERGGVNGPQAINTVIAQLAADLVRASSQREQRLAGARLRGWRRLGGPEERVVGRVLTILRSRVACSTMLAKAWCHRRPRCRLHRC